MAKNRGKRKGSGLPSASHTSITLREENSGRKQNKAKGGEKGGSTNMKSMLKLQHLKSLAMWASQEASIPSLGAFFGHRLMTCGVPDQSLFPCQRCETILQPGQNCTVRIEPSRARAQHGTKKSYASTQNNVIYWCHFCSHHNVKRGTPKGHMKEICPKVKPSSVSKHTNPMPQNAADPETVPQNEVEVCKTDEIASSATALDIPITDSPATPTVATDTPITNSPATPLVRTGNTLLGGKRRKRNKPGSSKQAEPESNSASADTQKSVSTSNKRRRKSWTSLREIAETSEQGNTRNIANLTIPFFL
ncbi:hypothetical protein PVL29_004751 [Vitis rotundifolia]|uniref:Uncharacterized protein n=1 Tax=Vitis rotundifolia TaxID=103349 RepID=A0AA39A910_VITRO|nr:hypothetical protein PVL29_004751 [Vitis rotundifolia]